MSAGDATIFLLGFVLASSAFGYMDKPKYSIPATCVGTMMMLSAIPGVLS